MSDEVLDVPLGTLEDCDCSAEAGMDEVDGLSGSRGLRGVSLPRELAARLHRVPRPGDAVYELASRVEAGQPVDEILLEDAVEDLHSLRDQADDQAQWESIEEVIEAVPTSSAGSEKGLSSFPSSPPSPTSLGGWGAGAKPSRRRPKKPRSKGRGPYCVLSHKGNVVHCYENEGTAERVARSFGARSGAEFRVEKRK